MTAREYLGQAYRLENKIQILRRRIEELQEMRGSVSSPGFEEHYNASRNTDAPFVKTIEKIMEYEKKYEEKMRLLLDLKEQIRECIDKLDNPDEALVLEHRYIYNSSWVDIGNELYVDDRTVRRWHNKALYHFKVPENPITI